MSGSGPKHAEQRPASRLERAQLPGRVRDRQPLPRHRIQHPGRLGKGVQALQVARRPDPPYERSVLPPKAGFFFQLHRPIVNEPVLRPGLGASSRPTGAVEPATSTAAVGYPASAATQRPLCNAVVAAGTRHDGTHRPGEASSATFAAATVAAAEFAAPHAATTVTAAAAAVHRVCGRAEQVDGDQLLNVPQFSLRVHQALQVGCGVGHAEVLSEVVL